MREYNAGYESGWKEGKRIGAEAERKRQIPQPCPRPCIILVKETLSSHKFDELREQIREACNACQGGRPFCGLRHLPGHMELTDAQAAILVKPREVHPAHGIPGVTNAQELARAEASFADGSAVGLCSEANVDLRKDEVLEAPSPFEVLARQVADWIGPGSPQAIAEARRRRA